MKNILTILITIVISSSAAFAQNASNDILIQKPNFLKAKLKATDSLFLIDLAVLKQHIEFDDVDTAILKPRLLYFLLSEKSTDSVINYQTLINTVAKFKTDIGYKELRKGILLYKELAHIKVNPNNWTEDQNLFRRLGFTEADLEDFLLFISKPENKELTYSAAYFTYMKEIDSLQ